MRRILVLVKKDLYFNRTVLSVFFAGAVFLMVVAIFGLDGNDGGSYYFLFYTCLLAILPVPYSYHLEDNLSTRKFMKSWPVTVEEILTAKYLMGIGFAIVVSGLGLLLFNALGTEYVPLRLGLIPIVACVFFSDIYILIVYRWDPHIASITCSFPLLIPLYILLHIERTTGIHGDEISTGVLLALLVVAVISAYGVRKTAVKLAKRQS